MRGDISSLNEAIVSEDDSRITEALERLKNSSMEIGKAIYSQGDGQDGGEQQPSEEEQKQEEEKTEEPAAEEAEKKEEEGDKKEKEEKK